MDTLQYINENKEWLFSGAGLTLIPFTIWVGKLLLNKYKTQPKVTTEQTKDSHPPAFDLDNATAKLTRTSISGGVPHGLVKATNGASFEMTDSAIAVVGPNVECPPPNGEHSADRNSDLRQKAYALAAHLREFDSRVSAKSEEVFLTGKLDQLAAISQADNEEFNVLLRHRSLSLMSEMLHRLQPIERSSLPIDMRCGINAAIQGQLAGSHPAAGLASFFELLAEKFA